MIKGILSETKIKGVLSGELSWSQYWAARDDGRDGTSFDKGKVLFDFDDSPITNYTYGFPLFVEKGIKVTFYIITNLIEGGGGGSLSWDNVIEMYNAGMDMQSHADQIMTDMTDEEISTMFEDENALFLANDLPLPHYFAYPGGYWDDRVMDATGLYRKTGTAGSPQLYRYTNRKNN